MKRERHFVPSKERINIFYGALTEELQKYKVQEIVRKGDKLTIRTKLEPRNPKEKNLVIETEYKLDLVRLLSCSDDDVKAVAWASALGAVDCVKERMIEEGMSKHFYWI